MNNDSLPLAHQDLMRKIQNLAADNQSGTIFITSHDGHLARIVLDEGRITHLIFDSKYVGYDAIERIHNLTFARLQFISGIFENAKEVPLPDTADIFQKLFSGEGADVTQTISSDMSDHVEEIQKALAQEIGPIAMIVCEEYVDNIDSLKTIDDLLILIDTVALEISDVDLRQAFKEQIKTQII